MQSSPGPLTFGFFAGFLKPLARSRTSGAVAVAVAVLVLAGAESALVG